MLKLQELSRAMDPHWGSAPGSRGPRSAAIVYPSPPPQAPPLDPALFRSIYCLFGCLELGELRASPKIEKKMIGDLNLFLY